VIFSENFGENFVILLQTVAKWWCIKRCEIFSRPLCTSLVFNSSLQHQRSGVSTL